MTPSLPISPEEIESIVAALEQGSHIDRSLLSNGRIHIDRPQPFVCLHRIPEGNTDPGTHLLLGGLASYIVASGKLSALSGLKALITRSLGVLSNAFGAVALLEVNTMSSKHLDGNAKGAGTVPALKLTAPLHGAPVEVLETFEMAVAAAEWPVARPELDVQYASAPHSPQMPVLVTEAEAKELKTTLLCLEISPFFRDPKTLDLFLVQDINEPDFEDIVEAVMEEGYAMVQEYVESANKGDVRLFLLNGRPLTHDGKFAAIHRVPPEADFRSNMSVGGKAMPAVVTPEMLAIVEQVSPQLVADGLFLVGLDIIGNKLLEVNVFSPGGLHGASQIAGIDFSDRVVEALEKKVHVTEQRPGLYTNREIAVI